MAKRRNKCTAQERIRYAAAYLEIWDALNESIRYIAKLAQSQTLSPAEVLALERKLSRLKAEQRLLEAKRQAFKANEKAINPPNQATVKEARAIADKVDDVIANSLAAGQVIGIATSALALFNRIQAA